MNVTQDTTAVLKHRKEAPTTSFAQLALLVCAATVALRLRDPGWIPESLFGEDANIFITQTRELGLQSLWTPLVGYLFVYHRLVALLAGVFPLVATPYLFFGGWFIAVLSTTWAIRERAVDANIGPIGAAALSLLIVLQPSDGVGFFNLNHSGYFLGITLSLLVCIPTARKPSPAENVITAVASVTGPYSVFLSPILFLQWLSLRDFQTRKATYLLTWLGAATQATLIVLSPRVKHVGINTELSDWLCAARSFLLFGNSNTTTTISAGLFWTMVTLFAARWLLRDRIDQPFIRRLQMTSCLLGLTIVTAISTASCHQYLEKMGPLDFCSRYFLAMYPLVFLLAILLTNSNRFAQMAIVCVSAVICASTPLDAFRPMRDVNGLTEQYPLQWVAFVKFQEANPKVSIPVNPYWPTDPPTWRVESRSGSSHSLPDSHSLVFKVFVKNASEFERTDPSHSPVYSADIAHLCPDSRYLGLEVDVWRERMGWSTLGWGKLGEFSPRESLRRFYGPGRAQMHFAFKRTDSDHISLTLAEGVPDTVSLRWHKTLSHGSFGAEITPPGGRTRIEDARLFCL